MQPPVPKAGKRSAAPRPPTIDSLVPANRGFWASGTGETRLLSGHSEGYNVQPNCNCAFVGWLS
jgi:hypothetical protein